MYMYKMKDVCQMTGLTEKAVRLYVEQELVEPMVEEGVHRKAYTFSEADIERLKDIAALRSAGFALADIKMMFEDPANISRLVEEKEAILAMEIEQKKSVQEVLNHLTIEEHNDVTKLADAIEPRSTYAKETKRSRLSREWKWVIAMLVFVLAMTRGYIFSGEPFIIPFFMAFGIVFGPFAIVMGFRYFLYGRRYKKLKNHGTGKIVAIVTNEKIEEFLGEEEMSTAKEIVTFLLLGFLGEIWKHIRLDAYHPIIQFQTVDGKSHTATVKHGGFKKSWHVGDELEIAWEDGKEQLVYICKDKVLKKKAFIHLMLGVVLLSASLMMLNRVLNENGLLNRQQEVEDNKTRELTEMEISSLMDHIDYLSSIVDVKRESFTVEELTDEEIMEYCYFHYQEYLGLINEEKMSGGYMRDLAKSYFGRKAPETDIMCACGKNLVSYDFASMMYEAKPTHTHEKEEVRCYDKYKEAYYDGKQFIVVVEKYWNELWFIFEKKKELHNLNWQN